jgi:flagella basal body P-ring formation protein FlgA
MRVNRATLNAALAGLTLLTIATGTSAASNGSAARASAGAPAKSIGTAAVITFRATASVAGRTIRLGDVAIIETSDPRLAARLEAVEVGAAPIRGHSRTVSQAYARVRIRQIGIHTDQLHIHGPALVEVTRPEQKLSGAALHKVACEAIEAVNPGATAQVASAPRDLRLPPGAVELKPEGAQPVIGTTGSLIIRVLVDGREEVRVPISFRLQRLTSVVVAVRDLTVGSILSIDDVRVEERPAAAGRPLLADVEQAVGQQVALPLRGGSPIAAGMLRAPVLVKRGDRIRLICRSPGFVISALGEALQNGSAGQTIRVRNLSSLREVTALVETDQTAEVPF